MVDAQTNNSNKKTQEATLVLSPANRRWTYYTAPQSLLG